MPGHEATLPLGFLRAAASVTPGQKIGYVADAAYTKANVQAVRDLASGADILFIEAAFADADAKIAAARAHLTTRQAGALARTAGAAKVEPFHFSPRYSGEDARLTDEVEAAFRASEASDGCTGP